jgi:hypothetical protein
LDRAWLLGIRDRATSTSANLTHEVARHVRRQFERFGVGFDDLSAREVVPTTLD